MAVDIGHGVLSVDDPRVPASRPPNIGGIPYLASDSGRASLLAYAAAAPRLFRPSLPKILLTWCSTVLGLMNSRLPISMLEAPKRRQSSTSVSRSLSRPSLRRP